MDLDGVDVDFLTDKEILDIYNETLESELLSSGEIVRIYDYQWCYVSTAYCFTGSGSDNAWGYLQDQYGSLVYDTTYGTVKTCQVYSSLCK